MSGGRWRSELAAGWPLLVAATIACGTGASSLVYYSFGLFVEPLQQHFHWSRGEVSSTLLFGSSGLVLAAPVLGWLIDRHGARRVALCAIPCFAAALFGLTRFDGPLAAFYAAFALTTIAGSGTTPILYTRAVAGSFDAARGLALGITLAGPGTAAMLLPPFMQAILAEFGWRSGFLALTALAILPWPLVYVWLKRAPGAGAGPAGGEARGMHPRAALRTRAFWTLVVGFGAISVACSALVVHMVPMLRDAGIEPARAARTAAVIGVGVILGRVGIGWLIDRLFAPRVAAVIFTITAAGCYLLLTGGPAMAPLAAFLLGFALGAEVDLLAYLTSRYFGLRHYGLLYATIYACFWIGIALGPALAGQLFDHYGDYRVALRGVVALLLFGAMAAASLPRFERATLDAGIG